MSSRNPQFFFDFQRKSNVNFVHISILPGNLFCRLAILTELRYNSISTEHLRLCRKERRPLCNKTHLQKNAGWSI